MLPRRVTDPLHAAAQRSSRFLDDHWLVRWFVIPVLFMGLLVLPGFAPGDSLQLTAAYLALAALSLLLALAVERTAIYVYARATGRTT
ncbi:hypothetical protein [Halocalculus aciditolerans]|uniref:Uncharacterized protein n=1 Tax=Halocalculus aciditolerans TaxID=1383812 RepID=A0A830F9M0_9EURY|nr:hypothetical protein [Halocalculus aciditolerans]GGL53587.1 hypothetical protein GCM10009039_09740 [Halocalculus aciditolerans]